MEKLVYLEIFFSIPVESKFYKNYMVKMPQVHSKMLAIVQTHGNR